MKHTSLAAIAALALAGSASAATLLTPGAVQVEYTLGDAAGPDLTWATNLQTDASGNGRTMAAGGNAATWAGSALAPGSSRSIFVNSTTIEGNGGTQAYVMNNTAGMASSFQASIFLSAPDNFGGGNSSLATVVAAGDLRLEAINNPGTNYIYSARIGATSLGSITVGANEVATGLLVQKVGDTFSFWTSLDTGASWTQQGSDLTDATATMDWANTHMFIKPGGGSQYSGYADDFKVVSVIPEPSTAALGLLASGGLLLRRRRA